CERKRKQRGKKALRLALLARREERLGDVAELSKRAGCSRDGSGVGGSARRAGRAPGSGGAMRCAASRRSCRSGRTVAGRHRLGISVPQARTASARAMCRAASQRQQGSRKTLRRSQSARELRESPPGRLSARRAFRALPTASHEHSAQGAQDLRRSPRLPPTIETTSRTTARTAKSQPICIDIPATPAKPRTEAISAITKKVSA